VPLYDLVRGGLGELRDSLGDFAAATNACLANDVSATTVANADTPAEGTGLWHLVRGVGRSGELTYQDLDPSQSGARDAEIDASASSCPSPG
jgi:hypothetical protein